MKGIFGVYSTNSSAGTTTAAFIKGLNGIPDPDPALADPKPFDGRLVAIPVLNGCTTTTDWLRSCRRFAF